MAFVGRTKRNTSTNPVGALQTATSSSLGPGAYNPKQIGNNKAGYSYAPFASSAERTAMINNFTPGPGEYESRGSFGLSGLDAPTNSFSTGVGRFHLVRPSGVPGPGSYNPPTETLRKASSSPSRRRAQPAASGGVEWQRVSSAPSIPAPSQSFGYEENTVGELVLQRPDISGHTGVRGDTVAPTDYIGDWAEGMKTSAKAANWGKYRTERDLNIKPKFGTPGPGNYNPKAARGELRGAKKTSSQFSSATKRWDHTASQLGTPGPGSYASHDQFKKEEPPREMQFFGSRSARMQDPTLHIEHTPGPGTYQFGSTLKSRDTVGVPGAAASAPADSLRSVAFISTSDRFGEAKDKVAQPGPGAYLEPANTAASLARRSYGRNASFGATSKRFRRQKADEQPGPGSYVARSAIGTATRRPNATFVSASTRFHAATGVGIGAADAAGQANGAGTNTSGSGPAPGSYNTTDLFHVARASDTQKSSSFASTNSRFASLHADAHGATSSSLGPGAYDPSRGRTSNRSAAPTVSAFRSGQLRFDSNATRHQIGLPGPGTYEHSAHTSFAPKRSYNITISGPDFR